MKNITVISSSLREGSNSEILAKAFVDGAKRIMKLNIFH